MEMPAAVNDHNWPRESFDFTYFADTAMYIRYSTIFFESLPTIFGYTSTKYLVEHSKNIPWFGEFHACFGCQNKTGVERMLDIFEDKAYVQHYH